jgi:hypothetical protein
MRSYMAELIPADERRVRSDARERGGGQPASVPEQAALEASRKRNVRLRVVAGVVAVALAAFGWWLYARHF